MTIELKPGIPVDNSEKSKKLSWVVFPETSAESDKTDVDIRVPEGAGIFQIILNDKKISLVLPDMNHPLFEEENFHINNHSSKITRQINRYNNNQIGIFESYEEDKKKRKEVVEIIQREFSNIPAKFITSLKRSLSAHAYHQDKRIREIKNNHPLQELEFYVKNTLYNEGQNECVRERETCNSLALFDRKVSRKTKSLLRKFHQPSLKSNIGPLKEKFESSAVKAVKNYLATAREEETKSLHSIEDLVEKAFMQKQRLNRQILLDNALWQTDIDLLEKMPLRSFIELIKDFVEREIKKKGSNTAFGDA